VVIAAAAPEIQDLRRSSKDGILTFDDPLVAVFEGTAVVGLGEETACEVVVAHVVKRVVCGGSVPTVTVLSPSTIHSRPVLSAHGLGAGGVVKEACCSLEVKKGVVENPCGEDESGVG
jgi:hypothetical protein